MRIVESFWAEVGRGMLVATVGSEIAHGLGLANASAEDMSETLSFGP